MKIDMDNYLIKQAVARTLSAGDCRDNILGWVCQVGNSTLHAEVDAPRPPPSCIDVCSKP